MFSIECACLAERVMYYQKECYFYRRNPASAMHKVRSVEDCKKVYQSHFGMLKVFEEYLRRPVLADRGAFVYKIRQAKETIVYTLMQVPDWNFIKKQMAVLRSNGIYPYSWKDAYCLSREKRGLKKLLSLLFAFPCFAYMFHFIWTIFYKNKKR